MSAENQPTTMINPSRCSFFLLSLSSSSSSFFSSSLVVTLLGSGPSLDIDVSICASFFNFPCTYRQMRIWSFELCLSTTKLHRRCSLILTFNARNWCLPIVIVSKQRERIRLSKREQFTLIVYSSDVTHGWSHWWLALRLSFTLLHHLCTHGYTKRKWTYTIWRRGKTSM